MRPEEVAGADSLQETCGDDKLELLLAFTKFTNLILEYVRVVCFIVVHRHIIMV